MRNVELLYGTTAAEGYTEPVQENIWDMLFNAMQYGLILQGKVNGIEGKNLVIFIEHIKGIIPEEEVGEPRPKKLSVLIGATVAFKVKYCDQKNGIVYLSRRDAIKDMSSRTWRELRKECQELIEIQKQIEEILSVERNGKGEDEETGKETKLSRETRQKLNELANLARKVGPVRPATVRTVVKEGAYVDIGGVSAFLPAYEISWGYVEDAREFLKPGQSLKVRIIRINFEQAWIRVSIKSLNPNPWENIQQRFTAGSVYIGRFIRINKNGKPIVELDEGVHVICNKLPLQENQILKPGTMLNVRIAHIIPEKRQIFGTILGTSRWA